MIRTRDALVLLALGLVARALLTLYLPASVDDAWREPAAQLAGQVVLVAACAIHLGRRAFSAAVFGPWPDRASAAVAVALALVLLMFTLGENAVEALALAQVDKAATWRLWGFHDQPLVYAAFLSPPVLAYVGVSVLVGPFVEEYFFRGLLLPSLGARLGPAAGALVVSLLFTALHFSRMYFVSTMVFSLSLCGLYLVLRSVAACWIAHAAFNLAAFVHQDDFDIHWTRPQATLDTAAAWRPELAMLALSVAALAAAGVHWRHRIAAAIAPLA